MAFNEIGDDLQMNIREVIALLTTEDQDKEFRLIMQIDNRNFYSSTIKVDNKNGFVAIVGKTCID